MVQKSHHTLKKSAIPNVILRSALAGRSSGRVTSFRPNRPPPGSPNPIVPTPGTNPNQFAVRIKTNRVAIREKTLGIICLPTMPSKVTYRVSTSASNRFCTPSGTRVIFCVDRRAQTTTRTVTIIVTNIEFVNQLALETRLLGVTVSSAASKYVNSIGISLSSENDTAPAHWRIGQPSRSTGG